MMSLSKGKEEMRFKIPPPLAAKAQDKIRPKDFRLVGSILRRAGAFFFDSPPLAQCKGALLQ